MRGAQNLKGGERAGNCCGVVCREKLGYVDEELRSWGRLSKQEICRKGRNGAEGSKQGRGL